MQPWPQVPDGFSPLTTVLVGSNMPTDNCSHSKDAPLTTYDISLTTMETLMSFSAVCEAAAHNVYDTNPSLLVKHRLSPQPWTLRDAIYQRLRSRRRSIEEKTSLKPVFQSVLVMVKIYFISNNDFWMLMFPVIICWWKHNFDCVIFLAIDPPDILHNGPLIDHVNLWI